ncbi:MFS transporter [Anaerolineales bacterium HSG24]|nr:MFS transporter [Anaerolineales bacterium HSG24]
MNTLQLIRSKLTSDRLKKTLAYYVAFIGLGLANSSLGPTLPSLAANTHSTLSQISILFIARSAGYLIGALSSGRLYDRLAGHKVMSLMVLGLAFALTLTPLVSQLTLLILILLVLGFTESLIDVGGNTLLIWVHRREVGPFMNGLHFFFGVGAFLGPIIIAQLVLASGNITWAYWTLALLIFPIALILLRLSSPASYDPNQAKANGPINYRLVSLMAAFFFLYVGAEVSFGGWIYTYATTLGIADKTSAAYLTSVFWGALTLGRLLSIPLAVRFTPKTMLWADLVGCILSVTLMLIWPASLWVIGLGAVGLGLSMASMFPTMFSLAERNLTVTGAITGWFFVGASLGGMTLPWITGQYIETIGAQVMLWMVMISSLLLMGVFAWIIRSTKEVVV